MQIEFIKMPGAVTETKSTPWTVAEQFVEERIKLKQSNSRIALALRNAKIHRPSLYLSAKKSFDKALERSTINAEGRNSISTVPTKKACRFTNCKQERSGLGLRENNLSRKFASQSCASAKRVQSCARAAVAKLDATKLHCSCETTSDAKPENSLGTETNCAKSDNQLEKTVALNTVNVKPWENDVVKSTPEPIRSQDAEREKRMDRNIARLMSLLQESNEQRQNEFEKHRNETQSGQENGDTTEHGNQRLLKPGRIVYSYDTMPRVDNLNNNCLSGVLMVSSKMPSNPCCFHQLPPVGKVHLNVKLSSNLDRNVSSYRLPALKRDCNLCSECRRTTEQVSRQQGNRMESEVESEHLKRLKKRLKLKERALLEKELTNADKRCPALIPQYSNVSSSETDLEHQSSGKLGESFSLSKLYLSHHSTTVGDHEKAGKTRTKIADSQKNSEMCSSATRQPCYKLTKMERTSSTNSCSSANKKSAKLLRSKEAAFSAKKGDRYEGTLVSVDHPRTLLTPLRGFTAQWNEFPEIPMLWRENTEVQEEKFVKEDSEEGQKQTRT